MSSAQLAKRSVDIIPIIDYKSEVRLHKQSIVFVLYCKGRRPGDYYTAKL